MSFTRATAAACTHRPMVGGIVVCAAIAKRNERIGQPDTGTGGFGQE